MQTAHTKCSSCKPDLMRKGLRRGKSGKQARPVEARPGIGLAAGGDVAMSGDVAQGQREAKASYERCELVVLAILERRLVRALELDADREIVAALAAAPGRGAGVPGAPLDWDELQQLAVPAHQEVSRDLQ